MDRRMGSAPTRAFAVSVRGIFLVAVAFMLAGCPDLSEPLSDGIQALNETEETIRFEVIGDGGQRFDLATVFEPGQGGLVIGGSAIGPDSLITEDGCTTGDLIALDARGAEIARHPPPLCDGDLFIVSAPSGSQPP